MEDKDYIKDLFSDKLGQFEAPVRPELWAGISSQIGSSTTVAASGLSVVSKVIIGLSIAASVAVSTYLLVDKDDKRNDRKQSTGLIDNDKIVSNEESLHSIELNNSKDQKLPKDQLKDGKEATEESLLIENVSSEGQEEYYKTPPTDQGLTYNENHIGTKDQNPEVSGDIKGTQERDEVPADRQETVNEGKANEKPIELKIDLPNTFTPNGDGINDKLFISGLREAELSDFNLIILDASNKVVYQTTDINFEWNGEALNGEPVQSGSYIYYFTAKDSSGKTVTKYSRLTVNRSR